VPLTGPTGARFAPIWFASSAPFVHESMMLRRRSTHSPGGAPAPGDTLPMIHPSVGTAAAPKREAARDGLRIGERLRAAALHLALSAGVACAVLALVLLAWYPAPMPALLGVEAILLIMLAVDVVLGPLFTLLVFDRRKRSLRWDLATIAAIQLAALAYGLHTVHQGRPAFVVFVKDRFEVVSPADLHPEARSTARSNPFAATDPLGPRWVAARLPQSAEERSRILFEALSYGRDVQHHPRLYVDYAAEAAAVLERALPIERLKALNPRRIGAIDAAIAATGRDAGTLRYLPIRGPARDGAVLVDASSGRVAGVLEVAPW
jgi:hypothetical protein